MIAFVHKSTDVQTSLRSTKSNRFRNAFRRQNEEENKKGNRRDIKIALIDNMKRSLFAAIDEMLDHVEVLHFPHPESISHLTVFQTKVHAKIGQQDLKQETTNRARILG